MKEEERFKYLIESGWTCDTISGEIRTSKGKISKRIDYHGYQVIGSSNSTRCKAHRFIWFLHHGYIPNLIDHINRDKTDNRICNLRELTKQENAYNTNAKGYYYNKINKKYISQISINGIQTYLGSFDFEEEARKSHLDAKQIYHKID